MKLITPYRLILYNRLRSKLGLSQKIYLNNQWFDIKDEKGSKTVEIVYREIMSGFYIPPIELEENKIVLDVGAHVGMFSIPLAKKYPNITFVCYEPDKLNFKNLLRNLLVNNIKNILAFNVGVGNGNSIMTNHLHENTGGSHSYYTDDPFNAVDSFTFNSIKLGFPNIIQLLKIDCEGAEYDFFDNPKNIHFFPCILMELHQRAATTQDKLLKEAMKHKNIRIEVIHSQKNAIIDTTSNKLSSIDRKLDTFPAWD